MWLPSGIPDLNMCYFAPKKYFSAQKHYIYIYTHNSFPLKIALKCKIKTIEVDAPLCFCEIPSFILWKLIT